MKQSDNYATPFWIRLLFENWFDPCPLNDDPEEDGLRRDWPDKTYVNPPYSNPLPWVEKSIEENKKGKSIVLLLLKFDCTTEWYARLKSANAHVLLPTERVKFNGETPPWSSALFILEKNGMDTELIRKTKELVEKKKQEVLNF